MEYRTLGTSGLQVSEIGLGTNNFGNRLDQPTCRSIVDECLEQGVNLIDTADIYGQGASEAVLGKILAGRRGDVVLATKFGMQMGDAESRFTRGASRRWIMRAVEDSLRRLDTDYIDLYQVHTPDSSTPIVETLQALDDLVQQGKVRYVGHSNFNGAQTVDADWTARTEHLARPISSQLYYNLLRREIEAEALPACWEFGLGVIAFYPLESGFLTGKYSRLTTPEGARLAEGPRRALVLTDENFEKLQQLETFATERGHTILELALGWLLSHDEVSSVIAGASSAGQVRQNVESSAWRLDASELEMVGTLLARQEVPMTTDRDTEHPEDLPWNDVPADSDVPLGSHDPAPAEVDGDVDDTDEPRDLSADPPDDPYHRDSLDERLAEEEPDRPARAGAGGFVDLVDEVNRDDQAEIEEPDDEDGLRSPADPAEEAAIHVIDDDRR